MGDQQVRNQSADSRRTKVSFFQNTFGCADAQFTKQTDIDILAALDGSRDICHLEPVQHFLFVVRCKQHIGQNPQHTGLLNIPLRIPDGKQSDWARLQGNGNNRPDAKPLVQVILRRIGFFCRFGVRDDHWNSLADSLYPPIKKFSGFIFFG